MKVTKVKEFRVDLSVLSGRTIDEGLAFLRDEANRLRPALGWTGTWVHSDNWEGDDVSIEWSRPLTEAEILENTRRRDHQRAKRQLVHAATKLRKERALLASLKAKYEP